MILNIENENNILNPKDIPDVYLYKYNKLSSSKGENRAGQFLATYLGGIIENKEILHFDD